MTNRQDAKTPSSAVRHSPFAIRKLRAALTFSPHDWRILLQAWALLLLTDWALRLLPFPRIRDAAARVAKRRTAQPEADAASIIRRTQQMVHIAARNHLYPMSCLRRALVLQRLLGRQGVATELQFGVQKEKEANDLKAHAWLAYADFGTGLDTPGFITLMKSATD